jgi:hypothetical protein
VINFRPQREEKDFVGQSLAALIIYNPPSDSSNAAGQNITASLSEVKDSGLTIRDSLDVKYIVIFKMRSELGLIWVSRRIYKIVLNWQWLSCHGMLNLYRYSRPIDAVQCKDLQRWMTLFVALGLSCCTMNSRVQYIGKHKEDDTIQGARIADLNQSFQGKQKVDDTSQGASELLARARVFSRQAEVHFTHVIAELMPMSADVSKSLGSSLLFTCNALEQGR